jgi:DNA invertase Pin-like site-specific DNA recombinase
MTEKPQGNRGAVYIRVSHGEKQDPQSQVESIRRKLLLWGLPIPAESSWYQDIDGRNPRDLSERRIEFQRLLSAVQSGQVDWICVESQDRWGCKDNYEFGYYAHQLRQADCHLWSCHQGCLTSGEDAAVFTATVGSQASSREQQEKGGRALRGKITRVRNGEWQGGYVAYGYDVACIDHGKELWRVVIEKTIPKEELWQRFRLYPDGRRERFDGYGVFPKKEDHQTFALVPSCVKQRVETAAWIFREFANGAWTQRSLCNRLNEKGIDCVYGRGWYASRLGPMLRNPVYYLGATVYNKKSHGRHKQYINGDFVPVQSIKGRKKTGRKNDRRDWIEPTSCGKGLIDKETWDAVQRKLEASPAVPKGIRSAALWLSGLIYCGRCGGRMVGWDQKHIGGSCYTCPAYRTYGKNNRFGCRLHRVHQDQIESCLGTYLEDAETGVKLLLKSQGNPEGFEELDGWMERRCANATELMQRMWQHIAKHGKKGQLKGRRISSDPLAGLKEMYDAIFADEKASLTKAMAKKEAELTALVERFALLPASASSALALASKKVQAADLEIKRIKADLVPLSARLDQQLDQLDQFRQSVERAIVAVKKDEVRHRAEAIRKVIERIDCHFEPYDMGKLKASRLVKVEISPLVGKPFVMNIPPEQG